VASSLSPGLLAAACIALLLAAGGLLLWQWAGGRQSRQAAQRHLDQRIQASRAPISAAAELWRGAPAGNAGLLAEPWVDAGAEVAPPPRKSRLQAWLPGWLDGVVAARTLVLGVVAIIAVSALAGLFAGVVGVVAAALLSTVAAAFALWLRIQRFRRQLVSQLPAFIDSMVRLITIGNSTHAAFQLAINSTRAPLRGYLERAAGLVRAGVDLDRALQQMADTVRIEEMHLLASILGLGVRYGGRADLLLERVGNFMRDREQAEHELVAMSAETRLSAWILGLLPVGVGGAIVMLNPDYFLRLWHDATGQWMIFGAFGLQLLGAVLLYRLARLA